MLPLSIRYIVIYCNIIISDKFIQYGIQIFLSKLNISSLFF